MIGQTEKAMHYQDENRVSRQVVEWREWNAERWGGEVPHVREERVEGQCLSGKGSKMDRVRQGEVPLVMIGRREIGPHKKERHVR